MIRNIASKNTSLLTQYFSLDQIKQILVEKLNTNNYELVRQSLYIICNISADENYKDFGMDAELLPFIKSNLVNSHSYN